MYQEGAGDVCGAAAGDPLPPGQQDLHRTRGPAPLPGLLLQGQSGGELLDRDDEG